MANKLFWIHRTLHCGSEILKRFLIEIRTIVLIKKVIILLSRNSGNNTVRSKYSILYFCRNLIMIMRSQVNLNAQAMNRRKVEQR